VLRFGPDISRVSSVSHSPVCVCVSLGSKHLPVELSPTDLHELSLIPGDARLSAGCAQNPPPESSCVFCCRARGGRQGSRSCQRLSKPISPWVTSHTCNRQALGMEHSVPSPLNRMWRREEAGPCEFGDHRGASYGMGPAGTSDSRAVGRCRKALPRLRPVPFSLSSKEFSRGTFEFVSPALLRGSRQQGRAGQGRADDP
jgi:hypothetical protein